MAVQPSPLPAGPPISQARKTAEWSISQEALKKISQQVRSWRLHRRTGSTAAELARKINPVVRGWMVYYGGYYQSALYPFLHRINTYLFRWMMKKYRGLKTWKKAARAMLDGFKRNPKFFAHWVWVKPVAS